MVVVVVAAAVAVVAAAAVAVGISVGGVGVGVVGVVAVAAVAAVAAAAVVAAVAAVAAVAVVAAFVVAAAAGVVVVALSCTVYSSSTQCWHYPFEDVSCCMSFCLSLDQGATSEGPASEKGTLTDALSGALHGVSVCPARPTGPSLAKPASEI